MEFRDVATDGEDHRLRRLAATCAAVSVIWVAFSLSRIPALLRAPDGWWFHVVLRVAIAPVWVGFMRRARGLPLTSDPLTVWRWCVFVAVAHVTAAATAPATVGAVATASAIATALLAMLGYVWETRRARSPGQAGVRIYRSNLAPEICERRMRAALAGGGRQMPIADGFTLRELTGPFPSDHHLRFRPLAGGAEISVRLSLNRYFYVAAASGLLSTTLGLATNHPVIMALGGLPFMVVAGLTLSSVLGDEGFERELADLVQRELEAWPVPPARRTKA
jgi:hypothetical protein